MELSHSRSLISNEPMHIGDGIYLYFDGHRFEIRTNDFYNPSAIVYIETEYVDSLIAYFANTLDVLKVP